MQNFVTPFLKTRSVFSDIRLTASDIQPSLSDIAPYGAVIYSATQNVKEKTVRAAALTVFAFINCFLHRKKLP